MTTCRPTDQERIEKQIRQKTYKDEHIDRTTKKKTTKKTQPAEKPDKTTEENGT